MKPKSLSDIFNSHLFRYIVVGGSAYVFEMSVLFALHRVLGLSDVVSVAISFWAGLIWAFVLQKLVTFRNYEKHAKAVARQVIIYGLLVAFNYGFTLLATRKLSTHYSVFEIRTAVIIITTVWNFFVYRMLFRESGGDETII
jgi:putative flippase GtrA